MKTIAKKKVKKVRAWAVIRRNDGVLFDDACGDSIAFYPIHKTKIEADNYRSSTFGKYKSVAKVIPVTITYTL